MSAFEQPKNFVSAPAGQDFKLEHRYTGVGLTQTGITTAAAAAAPYGVLYLPEKTGVACKVMTEGIALCKVSADAALKMGDKVCFTAAGLLKKVSASEAVVGVMQADAPASTIGSVLLQIA